jgi:hypothetical protein
MEEATTTVAHHPPLLNKEATAEEKDSHQQHMLHCKICKSLQTTPLNNQWDWIFDERLDYDSMSDYDIDDHQFAYQYDDGSDKDSTS